MGTLKFGHLDILITRWRTQKENWRRKRRKIFWKEKYVWGEGKDGKFLEKKNIFFRGGYFAETRGFYGPKNWRDGKFYPSDIDSATSIFDGIFCAVNWPHKTVIVFIGPESDHWQCLSLTDSLTDSLTHSCLVNLNDVTLACEDTNSKLVDIVSVANVVDEDRVGSNLLQIWELSC